MAEVTADKFTLKDSSGTVRATLTVANGETQLTLINKSGKAFATLSESFDGDGVFYLNGGDNKCFMALYAEAGNPAIFIYDKDGKILTIDSKGVHSNITHDLKKLPQPPKVSVV